VSEAHHEEIRPTAERRHRRALLLSRGDERDRQRRPSRSWPSAQQSRGEFAPAISTTRTSHAALSECEDTTKVQFNSRAGPQSFQPGASSRDPRGLQTETLGRVARVARPRGLATDWSSACHAIRRPRVVTMTKPRERVSAPIPSPYGDGVREADLSLLIDNYLVARSAEQLSGLGVSLGHVKAPLGAGLCFRRRIDAQEYRVPVV